LPIKRFLISCLLLAAVLTWAVPPGVAVGADHEIPETVVLKYAGGELVLNRSVAGLSTHNYTMAAIETPDGGTLSATVRLVEGWPSNYVRPTPTYHWHWSASIVIHKDGETTAQASYYGPALPNYAYVPPDGTYHLYTRLDGEPWSAAVLFGTTIEVTSASEPASTPSPAKPDLLVKFRSGGGDAFAGNDLYQEYPSGVQIAERSAALSTTARYTVKIENDGEEQRTFVLKAEESTGTDRWTVTSGPRVRWN